jgi:hypothetical protein
MRKSLVLASLLVLAFSAAALAGIPDSAESGFALNGKGIGSCHFVFNADGTADEMCMDVTLRDAFATPVTSCTTSVTIIFNDDPGDPNDSICACGDGLGQVVGVTDGNGIVSFCWDSFGGYGNIDVCVTAHCTGDLAIGCENCDFTSPDLDGSCEPAPGPPFSTDVIDLGLWATGLGMGQHWDPSDYNCSGGQNEVIDLGVWAGGLGKACP